MTVSRAGRRWLRVLASGVAIAVAGSGAACSTADHRTGVGGAGRRLAATAPHACGPGAALPPATGAWFGVSIDWSHDNLAAYARRLGHDPAMAVTFASFPMTAADVRDVAAAVAQARGVHSGLLLTLQPEAGLRAVTDATAFALAHRLRRYNADGVPIIVRFAHEMNGSWYPWGQQPRRYIAAFRTVADAVHRTAPGSAMMWAPSYGGGYPFAGGAYEAKPGSTDARTLDTNHNGRLDRADDSYRSYYPGDRYVDWVGLSLYQWGTTYPWGSNDIPAAGKFAAELTGTFHGPGTDERAVPDFYGIYGRQHHKPVAISETAALYAPHRRGAAERRVKAAWWRQVLAPHLLTRFPELKLIDWFEWNKYEREIHGRVDWAATTSPSLRSAFRAALPSWLRFGRGCAAR